MSPERLLLGVLAWLAGAALDPAPRDALTITRLESAAGPRWSLRGEATLDELVRALSRRASLALDGAELLPREGVLAVALEARPLEEVLAIVLGARGLDFELTGGTLRLASAPGDPATLARRAEEAWRAVAARGGAADADLARLARGSLAEVQGELDRAYSLYAETIERESVTGERDAAAPEALYRAGRVLGRLGHWAEAAQHFRTLAGRADAEPFQARARAELARAALELGDAHGALAELETLEARFPSDDPWSRAERRLVRARALAASGAHLAALRVLAAGPPVPLPEAEAQSFAVLAEALAGLGFEVEAARAWLRFAREGAAAGERGPALARAAELALASGDELATLFLVREAEALGVAAGLEELAHAARARLGLEPAAPANPSEPLHEQAIHGR